MNISNILLEFAKDNKKYIILYIIFTILAYPLEAIVLPQIYSKIFTDIKHIFKYIIPIFIILLIVYTSYSVISYIDSLLIPKFNTYLLSYIYQNILYKHKNNYTDIELGKLSTNLTTLPTVIRELTINIFITSLPKIICIVVINLYFFYISWKLGLLSIVLIIILCIVNKSYFFKCKIISKNRYHSYEKTIELVQNKLSNLFSIYSNGKIEDEIEVFRESVGEYEKFFKDNLDCVYKNKFANYFILLLLFIILNLFIIYLYRKKSISLNILIALFITILYYISCFNSMFTNIKDFIHNVGILEETDNFIKELNDTNRDHNSQKIKYQPFNIMSGDITIKSLNFSYNNKVIFNDFNLDIKDKDKVAIIGHSGLGKSTLFKLITGYYKVDDNMIYINGKDVNSYDLDDLRRKISYVNQNNQLFNGTVLHNIQYGNNLSYDDILKVIKDIGLTDIFKNLGDGLYTNVGVNGNKLSGGQKQMIHILRCFGKNNKIILLDEPTTSLDKNNKKIILNAIKELSKNSTMIIITHDNELLNYVDKVYTIK
jgi:ABC-type multidrug transport system fused ATPase/permease subunit